MGDRMGSSPIDRTNIKDDETIVFFHFLMKMSWLRHVVDAHVRFARATQIQVLDCPSLAVDRTKRKDDNAIVFFSFSAKNAAALPLISNPPEKNQ